MSEDVIIERTLQAARDVHLSRELAALSKRVDRLQAQVRLLAVAVRGQTRPRRQVASRTRPVVVK